MAGLRAKPRVGRFGAAIAGLMLAAAPAQALDTLVFSVPEVETGLQASLRAASLLLTAKRDGTTDPQDVFAAAQAEYGRLVGALYARGHYSPVIHILIDGREAASIAPLDAPARISRIEVRVQPGPLFTFGSAHVAPLAAGTVLPQGFATGARADSGLVQEAVVAGVEGWRAIGHAKAAAAGQNIVADHARHRLDAEVQLAPGPVLRFGQLAITGQQRMREARIREIAGLPTGDVFSPKALARSAERLRRTGVFRSVSLTEDEAITAPDLLGISAVVVEEKLRRYSFGAELASLEGATLSGTWLHRNLFGGAERLTVSGEVANLGAQTSGVDYKLGVTLDRPATFTPDTTLSFHAEVAHLDQQDYLENSGGLGFGFGHIFTEHLTGRAGLDYTWSEVTDLSGRAVYQHLALPVGLTWDNRDVKLDASKGYYLEAEAKPFLGFGTTDSGLRLKGDARAYRGFGDQGRFVLAGRVQAGVVLGPSLIGTPRDYLFYSGGGGTVRGQPYQSLGVSVLRAFGDQFKTGGMAFLAASVEMRAKVTDKIGVVGFVDAGHVGAMEFFDTLGGWHAGAGLGLRYDTGFGPVRLDVAMPVGGDTGAGVQVYLGLGQAF
ncbi:autotransporter assembly complex protein TamA [Rhodobacter ferrooxidans]|uniref:Surface antigen (D15) n=1 Tax=Rhodobacter ferrooxidans TaxID=371731 RepID=C8S235_9RHOB|nr:BamA/TamA family outer membrane protein [Rhodobacter sp. SW2]EEW24907.1 surface antigen (D15) [Rhodobacter sp. SW2]